MPLFAECCAVIPCNTIEDFPTRLDSAGARSLLGGLTAIWHPRLIASAKRTPTWYRADEAPSPIRCESGRYRLIVVPETCISIIPSEFRDVIDSSPFGIVEPDSPEYAAELLVRVTDRSDAITQIIAACEFATSGTHQSGAACEDPNDHIGFDEINDWMVHCEASELTNGRSIDVYDFYALGYTWWQVQVLTRRLRYTSNLDQIHFENQLQAAADAITSGNAKVACESLHDCFDALAEERDHYFSSDPSLIDLTLLTPSTISKWIDSDLANLPTDDRASSQLATPINVLIDEDVANAIAAQSTEIQTTIRGALGGDTEGSGTKGGDTKVSGTVGWCGGGPSASFQQEHHGIDAIEKRVAEAMRASRQLTGKLPAVYARLGGGVASQWLSAIASSGFQGVIPIDFLNGRGFGNESKVIIGEGASEIEALTAKPMDANDDSSFLTLGTTLGEAIDGGEIATGLMVHWPGEGCDSFHDVRRAATWTLALGKFWKIGEYFADGERPFHHGQSPKATGSSETVIGDADQLAGEFAKQTVLNLRGMLALIDPTTAVSVTNEGDGTIAIVLRRMIASAIGYETVPSSQATASSPASALLIHPAHPATRETIVLSGKLASGSASVFHASRENDQTIARVDVPAWGFAAVGESVSQTPSDSSTTSPNFVQKLGKWLRRPSRKILEGTQLSNEFMEVSINREHGGVDGVYSGRGRGNRFSTRLIQTPNSSKEIVAAICDSFTVIENTRASAIIELKGHFAAATGDATEPSTWTAQYQLDRGSRRLQYRLQNDAPEVNEDQSRWKSLASLRIAVADATPIIRSINSERLQRTSARSFSSSMGFVVEEADERTTMIASDHPTLHRRLEDRFVDTLIAGNCKTSHSDVADWHRFEFGFDVANSVAAAKSLVHRRVDIDISVPISLPSVQSKNVAQQGWLIHVSPTSLETQVVDVSIIHDPGDGEGKGNDPNPNAEYLAIHFRVIQTAGRAAKAALRFCRNVHAAVEVSSVSRPLQNRADPIDLADLESLAVSHSLTVESDRVRWNQPSHGVTHMVVLFPIGGAE